MNSSKTPLALRKSAKPALEIKVLDIQFPIKSSDISRIRVFIPCPKGELQLSIDPLFYPNYGFTLQIYSKCKTAKNDLVKSVYLVSENLNNSNDKVTPGTLKNELQNSIGRRKRKSEVRDPFARHLHHNFFFLHTNAIISSLKNTKP